MVNALSKAKAVAQKLKQDISLTEFWEWYDCEIKDIGKIENDLITFKDAIASVENDFWNRKDRRNNKRIKGHPSHQRSYQQTYGRFFQYLPSNKAINKKDILEVLSQWEQGTKSYKDAMSAYRSLVRKNGYDSIYLCTGQKFRKKLAKQCRKGV